ncbi:MAG: LysM peptidoglycan-binding domain-containing protein [Prevotellaceae bacterium]|jgi:LysM repeat protein|nr:LysM peptidoglycan-binding domain-containing protein [Prevotellaceae bacterium]
MKIFYSGFFITVFILLCGAKAPAQTVPASGGYSSGTLDYYFHIIGKNETLSRIAQIYNLSVNEILEVNTTISDPEKIVEGQKIKVPNYSHFIDKYPHDRWNFILYRVKQGDKLKSIAKEFNTDVDDIRNVNRKIENKPVAGSEIRVPVRKQVARTQNSDNRDAKKEPEKEDKGKQEQDGQPFTNPALTFNWGNSTSKPAVNETPVSAGCVEYLYKSGTVFRVSLIAPLKTGDGKIDLSGTSFLSGALIAVNEMKNNGLTVKLNPFDAGSRDGINRILRSPELRESDIIIAQVAFDDLVRLAEFAAENRIHLVVPDESKARSLVGNNPYIIQLHPEDDVVYNKIISKQFDESVLPILLKPEKPDSVALENYRATLKKRFGTFREQTHAMGLRNLAYTDILDINKLNLFFVCPAAEPSKNQPFVSDLIDRLNTVQKYRISVFGRHEWQDFELIEKSRYFNTNVHLVQPMFVDYTADATKLFVQRYRKAYNSEPGKHAFLGYDVIYYFLAVLRKYGPEFQDCVSGFESALLQSRYKLVRHNAADGFINEGCFLQEYTRESIEIKRE